MGRRSHHRRQTGAEYSDHHDRDERQDYRKERKEDRREEDEKHKKLIREVDTFAEQTVAREKIAVAKKNVLDKHLEARQQLLLLVNSGAAKGERKDVRQLKKDLREAKRGYREVMRRHIDTEDYDETIAQINALRDAGVIQTGAAAQYIEEVMAEKRAEDKREEQAYGNQTETGQDDHDEDEDGANEQSDGQRPPTNPRGGRSDLDDDGEPEDPADVGGEPDPSDEDDLEDPDDSDLDDAGGGEPDPSDEDDLEDPDDSDLDDAGDTPSEDPDNPNGLEDPESNERTEEELRQAKELTGPALALINTVIKNFEGNQAAMETPYGGFNFKTPQVDGYEVMVHGEETGLIALREALLAAETDKSIPLTASTGVSVEKLSTDSIDQVNAMIQETFGYVEVFNKAKALADGPAADYPDKLTQLLDAFPGGGREALENELWFEEGWIDLAEQEIDDGMTLFNGSETVANQKVALAGLEQAYQRAFEKFTDIQKTFDVWYPNGERNLEDWSQEVWGHTQPLLSDVDALQAEIEARRADGASDFRADNGHLPSWLGWAGSASNFIDSLADRSYHARPFTPPGVVGFNVTDLPETQAVQAKATNLSALKQELATLASPTLEKRRDLMEKIGRATHELQNANIKLDGAIEDAINEMNVAGFERKDSYLGRMVGWAGGDLDEIATPGWAGEPDTFGGQLGRGLLKVSLGVGSFVEGTAKWATGMAFGTARAAVQTVPQTAWQSFVRPFYHPDQEEYSFKQWATEYRQIQDNNTLTATAVTLTYDLGVKTVGGLIGEAGALAGIADENGDNALTEWGWGDNHFWQGMGHMAAPFYHLGRATPTLWGGEAWGGELEPDDLDTFHLGEAIPGALLIFAGGSGAVRAAGGARAIPGRVARGARNIPQGLRRGAGRLRGRTPAAAAEAAGYGSRLNALTQGIRSLGLDAASALTDIEAAAQSLITGMREAATKLRRFEPTQAAQLLDDAQALETALSTLDDASKDAFLGRMENSLQLAELQASGLEALTAHYPARAAARAKPTEVTAKGVQQLAEANAGLRTAQSAVEALTNTSTVAEIRAAAQAFAKSLRNNAKRMDKIDASQAANLRNIATTVDDLLTSLDTATAADTVTALQRGTQISEVVTQAVSRSVVDGLMESASLRTAQTAVEGLNHTSAVADIRTAAQTFADELRAVAGRMERVDASQAANLRNIATTVDDLLTSLDTATAADTVTALQRGTQISETILDQVMSSVSVPSAMESIGPVLKDRVIMIPPAVDHFSDREPSFGADSKETPLDSEHIRAHQDELARAEIPRGPLEPLVDVTKAPE